MSLGDFIKEKRSAKDMSQRDLAAKADLSNAEISRIEAGIRKDPSPAVLKALAKALDVPMSEMLQQAGVIERGEQIVQDILEKVGDMPISALSQQATSQMDNVPVITVDDLSPDEIEDVKKYIQFIKSKRS